MKNLDFEGEGGDGFVLSVMVPNTKEMKTLIELWCVRERAREVCGVGDERG